MVNEYGIQLVMSQRVKFYLDSETIIQWGWPDLSYLMTASKWEPLIFVNQDIEYNSKDHLIEIHRMLLFAAILDQLMLSTQGFRWLWSILFSIVNRSLSNYANFQFAVHHTQLFSLTFSHNVQHLALIRSMFSISWFHLD